MANGFLQDSKGNYSSTRLLMFVVVAYALIMGAVIVFKETSYNSLAYISGLLTLAGTLKIIQNGQEGKV